MKKSFVVFLAGIISLSSFAQQDPNLQAMVNAENAFIKMARDQNVKDAFLAFLSEKAVTAGPDGPRKGLDHIRSQAVKNDWLFWEVGFSEISASGDFGYNTGPWEYRVNKTDQQSVAFGEFNSVWKKQDDGKWKNVLDIGISHGVPTGKITWSTTKQPLKITDKKTGSHDEILKIENDFLNAASADRHHAYLSSLSAEARIMYPGFHPFLSDAEKEKFLNDIPAPANVRLMDSEIASSGDLGYVYGSAQVLANANGITEVKKATYLRIWKKEGERWKIVLDVLSF